MTTESSGTRASILSRDLPLGAKSRAVVGERREGRGAGDRGDLVSHDARRCELIRDAGRQDELAGLGCTDIRKHLRQIFA